MLYILKFVKTNLILFPITKKKEINLTSSGIHFFYSCIENWVNINKCDHILIDFFTIKYRYKEL